VKFFDPVPAIAGLVAVALAVMNGGLAIFVLTKRRVRKAQEFIGPEGNDAAISRFEQHIRRGRDGTFRLDFRSRRENLGIDPVLFADLSRSLEETNRKIRLGKISHVELIEGET
jgi:hypothetical protein